MKGRILIIAGSDSGGGAGIQADIKTVTALGGYAATAITALTAQNTLGVEAVQPVDPRFITRQMRAVLADIGADAIKIGMLGTREAIDAVADVLDGLDDDIPVVLDPVMVAKGGAPLLQPDAMAALKRRLLIRADVLTPNVPEAEHLTGMSLRDGVSMTEAAEILLTLGARAVLLKGGHLTGDKVVDLLATEEGLERFESPRLDSVHTHGTGCTLSSALATGLGQGMDLAAAVARAREYVWRAIDSAPGLGRGHGPLNHGHAIAPYGQG